MYKTDSRKETKCKANATTFHSQSLRSDKLNGEQYRKFVIAFVILDELTLYSLLIIILQFGFPQKFKMIMVLSSYSFSLLLLVKLSLIFLYFFIIYKISLILVFIALSIYGEQYRKEAMNQCTKPIQERKLKVKLMRQLFIHRA